MKRCLRCRGCTNPQDASNAAAMYGGKVDNTPTDKMSMKKIEKMVEDAAIGDDDDEAMMEKYR